MYTHKSCKLPCFFRLLQGTSIYSLWVRELKSNDTGMGQRVAPWSCACVCVCERVLSNGRLRVSTQKKICWCLGGLVFTRNFAQAIPLRRCSFDTLFIYQGTNWNVLQTNKIGLNLQCSRSNEGIHCCINAQTLRETQRSSSSIFDPSIVGQIEETCGPVDW